MIEPSGGQTIYRLVQTVTASQKVQEQIVQLIGAGRLAISERRPPERDLMGMPGVSRATLRESLTSLGDQGILEVKQGAGWFIQPKSEPWCAT
jgi:DNA-binding FadR family transcriptional regulator